MPEGGLRCPGVGALARGFAMVCRVSAELPRTTSPSRDVWGSRAGLVPSREVSQREACRGWWFRHHGRPGSACRCRAAAALSRKWGAVRSAWWGGSGSSWWPFSEEERTAVTAARPVVAPWSHTTVRRCHHIPTWDTCGPNLLVFHVAKNPFLKSSKTKDLFISSPNKTKLFPFLPTDASNVP